MPHTTKDSAGHTVHDTETIAPSTGRSGGSGKVSDAMRSVRGVGETIHGFGESVRGTALGAVDNLSKDKNTGNEEIAERGRRETQRGLADVGHGQHGVQSFSTYPTQSSYGTHGSGTASGTTESNQRGFQEGTSPASYASHGSGGAQPSSYGAASATQGREPYPAQFGNPNEQGSTVGAAGQESTIHPGSGQQLHEVQPGAHQHPYNPAQSPNVGSAYGQDSYQPTSGVNQERR